jgi:hypothetical protein
MFPQGFRGIRGGRVKDRGAWAGPIDCSAFRLFRAYVTWTPMSDTTPCRPTDLSLWNMVPDTAHSDRWHIAISFPSTHDKFIFTATALSYDFFFFGTIFLTNLAQVWCDIIFYFIFYNHTQFLWVKPFNDNLHHNMGVCNFVYKNKEMLYRILTFNIP